MVTQCSRRQVLQAWAVGLGASVAGCTVTNGQSEGDAPMETRGQATNTSTIEPTTTAVRNGANQLLGIFSVVNHTESKLTFSLTVTNTQNGTVLLNDSYTLSATKENKHKYFDNVINTMGTYELSVTTESGASDEFTWQILSCDSYDFILITLRPESIEFREGQQTVVPAPTCARNTSTNT